MRIAEVIGKVTLSQFLPEFEGASLRLVIPMSLSDLQGNGRPEGECLVAYDELGAGEGSHIALSEGGEAAQPFRPQLKPIDAYNSAILDHLDLE